MRNLKKILSLALALVMVLSMMVTASAAFEDQDLINDKYAEAVEVMATLGILQGDGTNFNPNGTLTRAEAAVILSKVVSGTADVEVIEEEALYVENPFTDVPAWAEPYVLYCYQAEIVGGRGNGIYDSKGTLTGYEFAKMLLVAAGFGVHDDFVGDANKTWQTKVLEVAKDADLLAGMSITLSKNITREQASQMALNAMKAGMTTATTWDVYVGETKVASYADILDAYLTAQVLSGTVKQGGTTVGGLLADLWNVVYTPKGLDNYGRVADTYKFYNAKGELTNMLAFNTPATFAVYTNEVAEATLKNGDLKGYNFADGALVWTDGVYEVAADTVAKTVAEATDANAVVEVYANPTTKLVSSVVVTNTHFAPVTVSADGKTASFDGYDLKVATTGLEAGNVVAYTKYAGKLDSYTVLEPTTAALSTYVNVGTETYYIDGAPYTLYGQAISQKQGIIDTMLKGEFVFYFGANGTIVYAHAPNQAPVAPVVNSNFAMVLKTAVKWEEKDVIGGLFEADGKAVSAIAAARLVLADGKTVDVPVVITEAEKDIAGTEIEKGDFYYVIDKKYFEIAPETLTLAALENKLVAYDNGVITFAKTTPATGVNDNVYTTTADTIVSTTPVVDGIVLNSNTVFVIGKYNAKGELVGYQAVKGLANVGATALNPVDPDFIVYVANWDAKNKVHNSKVAQVVFDLDYKMTDASGVVSNTGNYVYNTMTYQLTVNEKGEFVYNVSMIKPDASYVLVQMTEAQYETLAAKLTKGYGVYEIMSDGSIVEVSWLSGKVAQVVENFFTVDGTNWLQLSEKAAVAGELKADATIVWFETADADALIDYVWVMP